MKITLVAAALLGSCVGFEYSHRNHFALHQLAERDHAASPSVIVQTITTWACTTYISTISGQGTTAAVVPSPTVASYTTPGTYTIPGTTVTLISPTTVCASATTTLPAGTHTVGGVTTVATGPTTVTVPYASVATEEGTVTSKIYTTTYICPSAGTYTIGATTITPNASTTHVYPVPTSYTAGTYTRPETTVTITKTSDVVICPFSTSTPGLSSISSLPVTTSGYLSSTTSVAGVNATSASSIPASSSVSALLSTTTSAAVSSSAVESAPTSTATAAGISSSPVESAPTSTTTAGSIAGSSIISMSPSSSSTASVSITTAPVSSTSLASALPSFTSVTPGGSGGSGTAYGYVPGESITFVDLGIAKNWGWVITGTPPITGTLYMGAGDNDLSKGTVVGTFSIEVAGTQLVVTYNTEEPYHLSETQFYYGATYPSSIAPGKFGNVHTLPSGTTTDSFSVPYDPTKTTYILHAAISS